MSSAGVPDEALQSAQARVQMLEALLSAVPEFLYLIDARHRFVFVNRPLLELWGLRLEDAVGRTFDQLGYPPHLVALHARQLTAAFAGEVVHGENEYAGPGGTRYYEYTFFPLTGPDGRVALVAGVTRDATDLRRSQAEVRSRSQFERHLLGIVSHDLRTPLQTAALGCHMALRLPLPDERVAAGLRRSLEAIHRANRMVDDLLDFASMRDGTLRLQARRVDVHDVAEHAAREVADAYPRCILRTLRRGDGQADVDPDRIAQLVGNVVRNAFDHGASGTPVSVTTEGLPGAVVLRVHNHGEPIPADQRPGIFEPLQRASPKGAPRQRNVGLGLYIVRAVVQAHGGRIEVDSSAEGGTEFRVHLPRSVARAPARAGTA